MDKETERQMNKLNKEQTYRQTDRQTERQLNRLQTQRGVIFISSNFDGRGFRKTNRQTERQIKQTQQGQEIQIDRQTER